MVPIGPLRSVVLLFCLPDDHRPVSTEPVGDVGGIAGIILSSVQEYPDLVVTRKGLSQMREEVRLISSHDNQPSTTG
jgi:hypothetical protein